MGMGGATVALNHSSGGLHLNPATFGTKNRIKISSPFYFNSGNGFFVTPWLPNFNVDDLYLKNPNVIVGFDDFTLGYQFTYLNLGKQSRFDENNVLINTFNSYEYAHTLSGSFSLNKNIYVGLGANFIKSGLASRTVINGDRVYSANQVTFDVGLYADYTYQYQDLLITPSVGWSLTDFGYPISYTASGPEDPMPIIMRGGFGIRLESEEQFRGNPAFSFGIYASLSKVMARKELKITDTEGVSDTSYVALGPWEALFNSWDSFYRFNGQEYIELKPKDQFRTHRGLEVILLGLFSFRYGYYYEHPNNGARVYDTFGLGFHYKYFSFDYAKMDVPERGNPLRGTEFYQFSVNIPLDLVGRIVSK